MDFVRRIIHGGDPPFTPIPGGFPGSDEQNNEPEVEEPPAEETSRHHQWSKKTILGTLLRIPFVLLYYIMLWIIVLLSLLRPVCNLSGFYKRKNSRLSDPKTQLNNLLESLENESKRTLNPSMHDVDTPTYTFEALYNLESGSLSSDIVQGGYTDLLNACSEQCKFAIIYLHDSLLDNSMQYVNGMLCSEEFATLIKKYQVLLWFSEVTVSEGLQVANALKIRQFPFLGVLCLKAEKKIEVIGRLEGDIDKYNHNALENILAKGHSKLVQIRQQRQNVALQRLIREQQDSRYNESLRRDQDAARQRDSQREMQLEQEQQQQYRKQWLLWRKSELHPEPSGGSACRIAIRMDGNSRIIRKFDSNLRIEEIYAYVELSLEGLLNSTESCSSPPRGYQHHYGFVLISPAPRKQLDPTTLIGDEPAIYPSGNIIMETLT
ncbi:UBX3 (YDL091C) [Zygosaccharomyces parabailii]|nr:UBX3 (YDL091C) [Zygosaccharomyces parabailii]